MSTIIRRLKDKVQELRFPGSAQYWSDRYTKGGNSGAGSYGAIAAFKAQALNDFVSEHEIKTVLEIGCGDGHQLSLAKYPAYMGVDVAPPAIAFCEAQFAGDPSKRFALHTPGSLDATADLVLSLDVLLHLIEDDVFDTYMRDLFGASARYVGIFSPNFDERPEGAAHVRYRKFTPWIAANAPDWRLTSTVDNIEKGPDSLADFFFYELTIL